jgi:hypothetical protein
MFNAARIAMCSMASVLGLAVLTAWAAEPNTGVVPAGSLVQMPNAIVASSSNTAPKPGTKAKAKAPSKAITAAKRKPPVPPETKAKATTPGKSVPTRCHHHRASKACHKKDRV